MNLKKRRKESKQKGSKEKPKRELSKKKIKRNNRIKDKKWLKMATRKNYKLLKKYQE